MIVPPPSDDLEPTLTAAEQELIERVEAACALEPAAPLAEDTGELLRLDDALRLASQAAGRAIELRRQRRARATADVSCGVREFRDHTGREWRLWAVSPRPRAEKPGALDALRAEYQDGWLTFETLDETERRRLPGYPDDWATRSEAELEALLVRAVRVTPRLRSESRPRSSDEPDAGGLRDAAEPES